MAIPSLAMIPSGYKATKLYSVLPTDGVGDFTVSRPTGGAGTTGNATRVNSAGLIETVGADVPRLDYSDGGCPVLLTEPQSTNLVDYSSDFTQWTIQRANLSSNVIASPKGDLTGSLIVPTVVSGTHQFEYGFVNSPDGTYSIYIKADGYSSIRINSGSSGNGYAEFDTVTESVINNGGTYFEDAKITKGKDGWYRCELTLGSGLNGNGLFVYILNELGQQSYTGDGTSGIYVWGGQVETLPYATSIIETTGTTITRVADAVKDAGDVNTFNSTEGTLFVECAKGVNDSSINNFSITDGTDNSIRNRITIRSNDNSNEFLALVQLAGAFPVTIAATVTDITELNKLAFSYKENDFKFYVNGVLAGTDTVGGVPAVGTYDEFSFSTGGADASLGTFYGKTKQIQVFDTALTDAELITLTTL